MAAARRHRRGGRTIGQIVAALGLLGAVGGTVFFLSSGRAGAPSEAAMLEAIGAVMAADAARAEATGGAFGARMVFEPPARLVSELVDARFVRELSSVDRGDCEALDTGAYRCAFVMRGRLWCEGEGCDAFGGVGERALEEDAVAVFAPAGLNDWRIQSDAAADESERGSE